MMRAMTRLLFALLWLPSIASAQVDDEGHLRFGGYFALGVAGDADLNIDSNLIDLEGSADLDPTVGFGVRVEMPIHDFFAVGGLFELLTFEADDTSFSNSEREAVFDIDAWAKVRYAFSINADLVLEAYGGVPFGLSLAVLNDPDGSGDETFVGFNAGVLGGAMLVFQQHMSGFLELGWRHHQVFYDESDVGYKVVTNQFQMHFGFMYQL
jgi:hypothetical protein